MLDVKFNVKFIDRKPTLDEIKKTIEDLENRAKFYSGKMLKALSFGICFAIISERSFLFLIPVVIYLHQAFRVKRKANQIDDTLVKLRTYYTMRATGILLEKEKKQ